jgi:hypothetical protein
VVLSPGEVVQFFDAVRAGCPVCAKVRAASSRNYLELEKRPQSKEIEAYGDAYEAWKRFGKRRRRQSGHVRISSLIERAIESIMPDVFFRDR